MHDCNLEILGAYHDGELPADERLRVEAHLAVCPICAAELASLREISATFANQALDDFADDQLAALHQSIDASIDRPIWRLGGTLIALAASVLIVSCTWLSVLTTPAAVTPSPVTAAPESWETLATTLRPDPSDMPGNETNTNLADARLADWMLQGIRDGGDR